MNIPLKVIIIISTIIILLFVFLIWLYTKENTTISYKNEEKMFKLSSKYGLFNTLIQFLYHSKYREKILHTDNINLQIIKKNFKTITEENKNSIFDFTNEYEEFANIVKNDLPTPINSFFTKYLDKIIEEVNEKKFLVKVKETFQCKDCENFRPIVVTDHRIITFYPYTINEFEPENPITNYKLCENLENHKFFKLNSISIEKLNELAII